MVRFLPLIRFPRPNTHEATGLRLNAAEASVQRPACRGHKKLGQKCKGAQCYHNLIIVSLQSKMPISLILQYSTFLETLSLKCLLVLDHGEYLQAFKLLPPKTKTGTVCQWHKNWKRCLVDGQCLLNLRLNNNVGIDHLNDSFIQLVSSHCLVLNPFE